MSESGNCRNCSKVNVNGGRRRITLCRHVANTICFIDFYMEQKLSAFIYRQGVDVEREHRVGFLRALPNVTSRSAMFTTSPSQDE